MSLDPPLKSITPSMSKRKDRSTLYRLIEAGQLAHKALLVPLVDRGLEPGDDAVLFVLHTQLGATDQTLADELGLSSEALRPRLDRLIERDVIARRAVGPDLTPGLALTERGERIREVLAANWQQLEDALLGDLEHKQRKARRQGPQALRRTAAALARNPPQPPVDQHHRGDRHERKATMPSARMCALPHSSRST